MNHVADKYEMEFGPMSLDVFKDALMNRRGFRPARELARMGCKACQVGRNFGDKPRYFRFPELLDHFKTLHDGMRHMDGSDRRLNWRDDMVLSQETITVYGQEEESNAAVEHLQLEGKYMEREKPTRNATGRAPTAMSPSMTRRIYQLIQSHQSRWPADVLSAIPL